MARTKEEKKTANRKANQKYRETHPEVRVKERAHACKYRKEHPDIHRNWCKAHPEGKLKSWLKHKYGLVVTNDEALQLLRTRQTGVCMICGKNRGKKALCIDHDHSTDRIRGLLCAPCNLAFGLMEENIEWLQKMVEYKKQGN